MQISWEDVKSKADFSAIAASVWILLDWYFHTNFDAGFPGNYLIKFAVIFAGLLIFRVYIKPVDRYGRIAGLLLSAIAISAALEIFFYYYFTASRNIMIIFGHATLLVISVIIADFFLSQRR